MLEVLSIYFGSTPNEYPNSWLARTLIAVYREQKSQRVYGKGYGKDWKDMIKPDLLDYTRQGRLPLVALRCAVDFIRQAETLAWGVRRREQVETVVPFRPPVRVALNK